MTDFIKFKTFFRGLLCIVLVAFCAAFAHAQTTIVSMTSTYRLMDVQSATGAAPKQTYPHTYTNWGCQVNTTGSPSEVVLLIQANLTGSYYTTMATWTLSTDTGYANGQSIIFIANKPVRQVRANLTTLTGGTSPTVTVICTGAQ